nr:LacI family DNA-binding transcriptional regulator [Martelella sp. HB161492]
MREIADEAGVSIATASRALSGADGISAAVRARVAQVAARLDYVGQGPAPEVIVHSALDMGMSGLPAFQQELFAGIEEAALALGVGLTVRVHRPGEGLEDADLSAGRGARGHILMSVQDEVLIGGFVTHDLPAIIVNGFDPLMRLDTVAAGNRAGGYATARHLIGLGHHRVLMLEHRARLPVMDRFDGARFALAEAGLLHDPGLCSDMSVMNPDIAYDLIVRRLADHGGRPDFTAVQCPNDAAAFGVMAALGDAGFSIPDDVSVVGFDDIPMAASASPPLTTVAVPRHEIGAHGLRRLIARIREPAMTAVYAELAGRLVIRSSTGAICRRHAD